MKIYNINDYIQLTKKEVDWFDKNLIPGGLKSQNRPDLERGLLLYYLCKKIKAKKVLDIGTAGFFTARSMAKYGCDVDTIDIKGEKDPKDGWDNINFIKGDSKGILPQMVAENKRYDIIFVDGGHDYEDVKSDLIYSKQLSRVIVAHDYGNLAGPTQAISEELVNFDLILEDRMWKGAPYENGFDKNGNKIDYGVAVWGIKCIA